MKREVGGNVLGNVLSRCNPEGVDGLLWRYLCRDYPGDAEITPWPLLRKGPSHRVIDDSYVKSSRTLPGHTLGHLSSLGVLSTFHFELIKYYNM